MPLRVVGGELRSNSLVLDVVAGGVQRPGRSATGSTPRHASPCEILQEAARGGPPRRRTIDGPKAPRISYTRDPDPACQRGLRFRPGHRRAPAPLDLRLRGACVARHQAAGSCGPVGCEQRQQPSRATIAPARWRGERSTLAAAERLDDLRRGIARRRRRRRRALRRRASRRRRAQARDQLRGSVRCAPRSVAPRQASSRSDDRAPHRPRPCARRDRRRSDASAPIGPAVRRWRQQRARRASPTPTMGAPAEGEPLGGRERRRADR